MALDLSSLKSVRAFAAAFKKKHKTLDLLINNAGIMMPPYSLSEDGFESQLAANYLGHFVLTAELLPLLNATPGARVVSLSSLAHNWGPIRFDDPTFERGYNKRAAYGQSKLACLMFAYELDRRLRAAGASTLSVAAHPGVAATNLARQIPRDRQEPSPMVRSLRHDQPQTAPLPRPGPRLRPRLDHQPDLTSQPGPRVTRRQLSRATVTTPSTDDDPTAAPPHPNRRPHSTGLKHPRSQGG